MLFLDFLLNNWDRVPVTGIWHNEGNLDNIMLGRTPLSRVNASQPKTYFTGEYSSAYSIICASPLFGAARVTVHSTV